MRHIFLCLLFLWTMSPPGLECTEMGFLSPFQKFWSRILRLFYMTPPPQALLSTPQMIEFNGYPCEEHKIKTRDGYILTAFRIPRGINSTQHGRPVILQHGYLSSSNDFLLQPPDKALPYILADHGHDVWLCNFRGNNYSLQHDKLNPRDLKFWDFSVDEIVDYDVPAVINYVLKFTNFTQLNWIGHSLGTGVFFFAMDAHPRLQSKVRKMVALSPVHHVGHTKSLLLQLPSKIPEKVLQHFFKQVTRGRVVPTQIRQLIQIHAPSICYGEIPMELCNQFIYFLSGHNPQQMTPETTSLVFGHIPSDTSGKLVIHCAQSIKSGRIGRFDYGLQKNKIKYGNYFPPKYNLSNVYIPIQAFYSLNDVIIDPKDARLTISELGNVEMSVEVSDPNWSHTDFIFGKDARRLIYDKIIIYLQE